jgi:hypothetical protein
MVLPVGTYRFLGRVREAGPGTVPLANAIVEVGTVARRGLVTSTDAHGAYRLYGAAGRTTLRVTKTGYQSVQQTVMVADHATLDFELALLAPRPDISGTYTLTITASVHCGSGFGPGNLPDEVRVRTYTAAVQQEGPTVDIAVSEAVFHVESDAFEGRVEPARVVFDLEWLDGYSPPVIESIDSVGALVIHGVAVVSIAPNRLTGTLNGTLQTFGTGSVWDPPNASCTSADHQFVLSRRMDTRVR